MMELKFTNEELEALKKFKDEKCKAINQLLISNCETDIALLSDDADKKDSERRCISHPKHRYNARSYRSHFLRKRG